MKPTVVKVPAPMLLDRRLPASAKLLWMLLRVDAPVDQGPVSSGELQARSGFARHTVLRGLARLKSAGWLSAPPLGRGTAPNTTVLMPYDLLRENRVPAQAKLLYGGLQLTSKFQGAAGRFTYSELSDLIGLSHKPVRAAIRELQALGWLQISQGNRRSPILFTLRNPVAALREADVVEAKRRLEEASFLGEALMREYLSLLVDSDEFEDNATPGFLVNPYTDEEMQFDRYYPPRVAFEFNGPQHYGPTALYAKEADTRKQQGRDLIKTGICVRRGITLVVVHPADLTLKAMRQKVSGLLPLRNLEAHAPLMAYLTDVSRAYRRKARSEGGAKA